MDLSKLKPNPSNPRTIKKEEFERLKNKIKQFPEMLEKRPIVYDGDIVLGGNQRLQAVKDLVKDGFEVKESYFADATDWTQEQKRQFVITDNISDGEWDYDVLANEWAALPLEEWGIDTSKWDSGDVEEDEPPTLPEEAVSKYGEKYQLGRHFLVCGDATKIEDVEKLMDGKKADMVFTDPPYNADYSGRGQNDLGKIKNDNMSDEAFEDFIQEFLPNLTTFTKSGGVYYICCNWKDSYPRFYFNCQKNGINIGANIIWNKGSGGMGWQDYRYSYEFILYGFTEGHQWYGDRTQTDIWDFNRDTRQNYTHPTQKPIGLASKAIKNSSKEEDIVLDLFGGSGSTLIAAEQTNRTCYMMELDPKYTDVIRKRYAKFINKEDEWQSLTTTI